MHETNHASGFRTTENQKNPFISRFKIAPKINIVKEGMPFLEIIIKNYGEEFADCMLPPYKHVQLK